MEKLNQYYLIILPLSECSQLTDIAQAVLEQTNQSHHGTVTGSASLQSRISYLFFFFLNALYLSGRSIHTNASAGGDTLQYSAFLPSPHTPIVPQTNSARILSTRQSISTIIAVEYKDHVQQEKCSKLQDLFLSKEIKISTQSCSTAGPQILSTILNCCCITVFLLLTQWEIILFTYLFIYSFLFFARLPLLFWGDSTV